MRRIASLVFGLALVPAVALAQVNVGDIAVTGLTDQQFSIVDPVTGVDIPYPLSNLQGGGTSDWTQCITWDPANPTSFYLGGIGFLGRITITGPGTSNYQLITNQIGLVSQISIDGNGDLVVIDSITAEVLRVDPSNGAITPITSGPQPWGADANCGTLNPANGDIWVGGNKKLWKIAGGVGTPVLFASNWSNQNSAYCSGVLVDSTTGEVYITVLTAELVARVETNGSLTNMCAPHAVKQPNGLDFDQNGDLIVCGGNAGLNTLDRVPRLGGTPTPIDQISGQFVLASGVAVVLDTCPGQALNYGLGCAGSGGFVPSLSMSGCPAENQNVSLDVTNGLGGAQALLFFGFGQGVVPMGGGCSLNIAPLAAPMLTFPLFGSGPGNGNISLPGTMPPGTSGLSFTTQIFVVDGASSIGASGSNGVKITIG